MRTHALGRPDERWTRRPARTAQSKLLATLLGESWTPRIVISAWPARPALHATWVASSGAASRRALVASSWCPGDPPHRARMISAAEGVAADGWRCRETSCRRAASSANRKKKKRENTPSFRVLGPARCPWMRCGALGTDSAIRTVRPRQQFGRAVDAARPRSQPATCTPPPRRALLAAFPCAWAGSTVSGVLGAAQGVDSVWRAAGGGERRMADVMRTPSRCPKSAGRRWRGPWGRFWAPWTAAGSRVKQDNRGKAKRTTHRLIEWERRRWALRAQRNGTARPRSRRRCQAGRRTDRDGDGAGTGGARGGVGGVLREKRMRRTYLANDERGRRVAWAGLAQADEQQVDTTTPHPAMHVHRADSTLARREARAGHVGAESGQRRRSGTPDVVWLQLPLEQTAQRLQRARSTWHAVKALSVCLSSDG
ncbi:hypothetical protein FA95DRAFT_1216961 [Auriscalpium vulgare]|uniref:Uncharacterized protein n=1 Tax=Auriscalpium vulgare TaxID=40419 RepID=A0ACB8R3M7_9AGAM|nr:hypothetical protein FA95DRAFT_1216961 [Auriscalpium vulgare]